MMIQSYAEVLNAHCNLPKPAIENKARFACQLTQQAGISPCPSTAPSSIQNFQIARMRIK